MTDLPPGWEHVRLDEIAEVRLGRQRSPKNHSGDNMRPYLRAANVDWDGLKLDDVKHMNFTDAELEIYRLRHGDIVLSEASGSASEVGKPALWDNEIDDCCFQNTLIRVRSHEADPKFLLHLLRHEALRGAFVGKARGVGIYHIGATRLSEWPVDLPPLAEQHRIVAALEDRLSRLDVGCSQLSSALHKISRFRDAAMANACIPEPDIVEDKNIAPGLSDAGVIDGTLPPIPATWRWLRLGQIADVVGGITKDAKKQAQPDLQDYPYLRVANVQRGMIDTANIAMIRADKKMANKLKLMPGDVLMNEGGDRDKLGRGWVWEGQISACIHQNHVYRARIRDSIIHPKLLSWHANGFCRNWFEVNGTQSVNLASISLSKIKLLPVPIPPRSLQAEMVDRTERCLSILDSSESSARTAAERAVHLRRSLLAEAFAGRLVPQDPADEPASVLLEQIRAERTETPKATRTRRATTQKDALL